MTTDKYKGYYMSRKKQMIGAEGEEAGEEREYLKDRREIKGRSQIEGKTTETI